MTRNGVIPNRRTPTSQNKKRSLYLKEGLLLAYGCGLGMKSLTRTRKPYFPKYAADQSPQQTQTQPLLPPTQESHQTVQRETMDEIHKSTVKCSKQTPDSDLARSFCPRHTIWQRIMKMEGDNSCHCNLHMQRHGPNLHGRETGVS